MYKLVLVFAALCAAANGATIYYNSSYDCTTVWCDLANPDIWSGNVAPLQNDTVVIQGPGNFYAASGAHYSYNATIASNITLQVNGSLTVYAASTFTDVNLTISDGGVFVPLLAQQSTVFNGVSFVRIMPNGTFGANGDTSSLVVFHDMTTLDVWGRFAPNAAVFVTGSVFAYPNSVFVVDSVVNSTWNAQPTSVLQTIAYFTYLYFPIGANVDFAFGLSVNGYVILDQNATVNVSQSFTTTPKTGLSTSVELHAGSVLQLAVAVQGDQDNLIGGLTGTGSIWIIASSIEIGWVNGTVSSAYTGLITFLGGRSNVTFWNIALSQLQIADDNASEVDIVAHNLWLNAPVQAPTPAPTMVPTAVPTAAPTMNPNATVAPTAEPTSAPTEAPTEAPTDAPTEAPTDAPTAAPTDAPTAAPTADPTSAPTADPTSAPTADPTPAPTSAPTVPPARSSRALKSVILELPYEINVVGSVTVPWGFFFNVSGLVMVSKEVVTSGGTINASPNSTLVTPSLWLGSDVAHNQSSNVYAGTGSTFQAASTYIDKGSLLDFWPGSKIIGNVVNHDGRLQLESGSSLWIWGTYQQDPSGQLRVLGLDSIATNSSRVTVTNGTSINGTLSFNFNKTPGSAYTYLIVEDLHNLTGTFQGQASLLGSSRTSALDYSKQNLIYLNYQPTGPRLAGMMWYWWLLIFGGALLVIIIVVVLVMRQRRRKYEAIRD